MHVATVGSGGFFDDDDARAAQNPIREEYRPPAWMQAPEDELPVRLVHDAMIARTDAAVILLREVRVFSVGFEVVVDWVLRRRTDDPWEWQRLAESALRGGFSRNPPERGAGLRHGLALSDGRKVQSVDVALALPGAAPEPPTAMPKHGGGSGGDRLYTGSGGLWVWSPEPLRGTLQFVTEWAQLGIPVTIVALDGDSIADAAAGVRPLWEATG